MGTVQPSRRVRPTGVWRLAGLGLAVSPPPRLVLASASPARLKTLRAAGIEAEVIVSGIDESAINAAGAGPLALLLARLKAEAVAHRLDQHRRAGRLVLGCDSLLEFDGEVFGKPADQAAAIARWYRMRGRTGVLHTGHCLVEAAGAGRAEAVASATVRFADLSDAEVDAYVGTGEPLQVAGGFTIDGIGGPFITGITGDPGTVIGLSLPLLRQLLARLGVAITDLWEQAAADRD
jgi:septum formation protein